MGQSKIQKQRIFPPHGLRVTVRMRGAVISQTTHWPKTHFWVGAFFLCLAFVTGLFSPLLGLLFTVMASVDFSWGRIRRRLGREVVLVGESINDPVPTPSGRPLARARWRNDNRIEIVPIEDGAQAAILSPGERWSWSGDNDVQVEMDLVPRIYAPRGSSNPFGDVALLSMVLMLMVGVGQARLLYLLLMPDGFGGGGEPEFEASPELIARLLERDFDGAEEVYAQQRVDRQEYDYQIESDYLPPGNDGPTDRAGGGSQMGEEISREDEKTSRGDDANPKPDLPEEDPAEDVVAEPEALPELERVEDEAPDLLLEAEREALAAVDAQDIGSRGEDETDTPPPMERFIGWGFRDWFDVQDARRESVEELAWQLEMVRERLRINPDDPYAINLLGNYAYLAENTELSRESYERYIKLYPDEPLGYNNLALTYKRSGEYVVEEQLYRTALEFDNADVHVLNNLAINLARQDRFDEAVAIMEDLEQLDPDNPYTDLHRAKIYAAMGQRRKAYQHLQRALEGAESMSSLHHIEFRQDLRLEPLLDPLRQERKFARLLRKFYAEDADYLINGGRFGGDDG
ncbi:MAG: tetratricopeptide repeat protein [Myxococcota bacterium]